jgi:hypothetical protein
MFKIIIAIAAVVIAYYLIKWVLSSAKFILKLAIAVILVGVGLHFYAPELLDSSIGKDLHNKATEEVERGLESGKELLEEKFEEVKEDVEDSAQEALNAGISSVKNELSQVNGITKYSLPKNGDVKAGLVPWMDYFYDEAYPANPTLQKQLDHTYQTTSNDYVISLYDSVNHTKQLVVLAKYKAGREDKRLVYVTFDDPEYSNIAFKVKTFDLIKGNRGFRYGFEDGGSYTFKFRETVGNKKYHIYIVLKDKDGNILAEQGHNLKY